MKVLFRNIFLLAILASAYSCKKDNYDPPSSMLSGRLVYQGQPIGVEYNSVGYDLYQYGFGQVGPISSTFGQDGSYSQLLYNGSYKLVIPNGQGPFMWKYTATGAPDSLAVTMNGNQTLDIEVTPYYMIANPQFSASGRNVTASFKLQQVVTDPLNAKAVESVVLIINKTQFVARSNDYSIQQTAMAGADITDMNNISLSVAIPDIIPTQNYVFAAIGVKLAGVEDILLSPVQKVTF